MSEQITAYYMFIFYKIRNLGLNVAFKKLEK